LEKEVEDMGKAQAILREEFDSMEMSVQETHFAIVLMQEDIWDLNDLLSNVNNQVERIQVEDVSWCHSRISALGKPNNPANHSLWHLANLLSTRLESQEDIISELKVGLARAYEKIGVLEMLLALVQMRVLLLEDVMESSPTSTDLTSDDSNSEYTNVCQGHSAPRCLQRGNILSEDIDISQVGCPSQTLHNEGTLAI
jgi:hypothetical protein